MNKLANLTDIWGCIDAGGFLRFTWKTCSPVLFLNGTPHPVDGRSYQAFLRDTKKLRRTQSGTIEAGTTVIEWSKMTPQNLCKDDRCPACGAQCQNRQDHKTCHECINCGTQWPRVDADQFDADWEQSRR